MARFSDFDYWCEDEQHLPSDRLIRLRTALGRTGPYTAARSYHFAVARAQRGSADLGVGDWPPVLSWTPRRQRAWRPRPKTIKVCRQAGQPGTTKTTRRDPIEAGQISNRNRVMLAARIRNESARLVTRVQRLPFLPYFLLFCLTGADEVD